MMWAPIIEYLNIQGFSFANDNECWLIILQALDDMGLEHLISLLLNVTLVVLIVAENDSFTQ